MKKIFITILAITGLLATSCDSGFEELNVDPDNPTEVPAHLLLGNIIRNTQNNVYNTFLGGDMGACWSQQWSKVQYNDEERYLPRRGVIDGFWGAIYSNVLYESKKMGELAQVEGNTNLQAVSLVLSANGFQLLTDAFGPIPYSEALNPDNTSPKYDSQEEVYTGIIESLTQAEALFASGTGTIPASSDLIYGGDVTKWRKFANALKLKALMRISKVKPSVATQIQALVNAGNLMTSNSDSAQLVYLPAQPDANPIYETVIFGARAEWKVSSVLVAKLNSLNDPRLAVFAQRNNANAYVGNIPGEENSNNYNGFSSFGTKYLSATLPGVFMSYAQQEFLLAEAANEGLISGGIATAKTHYYDAIEANLAFNEVAAASSAAYLAQPNLDFSTQNDARQKIAEQEWLALFGQGFEAWTEWRRTKFPALLPVVGAAEASIPSRYYYPTTEISLNKTGYTNAVGTLSGGDKLTTKLWFIP